MSPKFTLNKTDLIKGLTHFGFYILGAVITATLAYFKTVDFGTYAPVAVVVLGFLGDIANKFVQGK